MTTAVRTRRRSTSCACGCGRALGRRGNEGRGLSATCYRRMHERGEHLDYPRRTLRHVDLAEDWPLLAPLGPYGAAARLGVSWSTLDRALHRCVAAGLLERETARPWWDYSRGRLRRPAR